MKPCCRADECAACHIKGPSGKHLAVLGMHFRSADARWKERERQRCELRMRFGCRDWTLKTLHHVVIS